MTTTRYDRRRAARETQRQVALMGESLAAFHEREAPHVALGDRLPRVRCTRTPSLFSGLRDNAATFDLFDQRDKPK